MTTTKAKDTQLPLGEGPIEEPHEVPVEEVTREPQAEAPASVPARTNPLEMVRVLLEQGERTAETVALVERLVALEERTRDRAARDEFYRELIAFQSEVEPIERTAKGTNVGRESGKGFGYWYAPLPVVVQKVREPLKRHGFAYRWSPEGTEDGKRLRVRFFLSHIGGHTEENEVVIPTESKGGMSEQQKVSNALAFGMRLSMTAGLGLTSYDPDLDGGTGEGIEYQPVTEQQAADLETLVGDAGMDKEKFLQSLGAKSFAEVKGIQLPHAVTRLRARIEKKTQQGTAS